MKVTFVDDRSKITKFNICDIQIGSEVTALVLLVNGLSVNMDNLSFVGTFPAIKQFSFVFFL